MSQIALDGIKVYIQFLDEIAKNGIQNEQHGLIFIYNVGLHVINMDLLKWYSIHQVGH